jgi:2-isopropylmalate synthase
MAVANSLAAVRGGARQIECAVNGIGERAGNCALEEVVMALRTRADAFGVDTGVDTTRIMAASRTLAQVTNTPAPRNKPIVGANAFAHEAGIHQHGILQNRETYEIMKPEDIGLSTDGIVLGRHSGRHALAARAKELGYVLEGAKLERAFAAFRAQADEVGIVDAARLLAMLAELETGRAQRLWKLSKVDIRAPVSDKAWPVARVELDHGERGRVTDIASAPGALDAAFAAVSQMIRVPARVETLEMQYLAAESGEAGEGGRGEDGQGANVLVEMTIDVEGEVFAGRARARDILPCCVSAFIDAASNAEAVRALRGSAAAAIRAA